MRKPWSLQTPEERERTLASGRLWYAKNKARKQAANKHWQNRNPERFRELQRDNGQRYYQEGRYSERVRAWELKNRKSRTLAARKSHLKSNYDLTGVQYNAMIEAQAGLCNMCCEPMNPVKGTHVDHDHKTGKIRGLLCPECNLALGHIERRSLVVEDAVAYLEASG